MEKTNLWRLHNVSEAYGKRPSEIMGFVTDMGAWQFDEICLMISRRIENEINNGNNPFKQNFNKIQEYAPVPKRSIKSMKIPENGVW